MPIVQQDSSKVLFENNYIACQGSDGTAEISGASNLQTTQINIDSIQKRIANGGKICHHLKKFLHQIKQLSEYVKTLHK